MKIITRTLILAAALALPHPAAAQGQASIVPPPMPGDIEVDQGFVPFLAAHAIGTQNYMCVANGTTYGWATVGPQATLFNASGEQTLTHFLSSIPYSLLPGPAWQHSRDSSIVWGQVDRISTDSNYVAAGAIPWLRLTAAVVGDGPTGGDKMLATRFIQRLNTLGGKPPADGCSQATDIQKRALVPYEADYYFYKEQPKKPR